MSDKRVRNDGRSFEKAVAAIQARLDPTASVVHDEVLIDRLGQRRQFDVVMRGVFCGHPMLGVMECKDLKGRVGIPEIDAFIQKAADVNANFKVLASRNGFSRPALQKAKHYGVQCLSLIPGDLGNSAFRIGTYWNGFLLRWSRMELTLKFSPGEDDTVKFGVYDPTIAGKRLVDWYTNFLASNARQFKEPGWVADRFIEFSTPREVVVKDGISRLCSGVAFRAERIVEEYEYFVGLSGDGFFDWSANKATFAPTSTIVSASVPTDMREWKLKSGRRDPSGFIEVALFSSANQFEVIPDALDLEKL